jgi:hypothetical protein
MIYGMIDWGHYILDTIFYARKYLIDSDFLKLKTTIISKFKVRIKK